MAGTVPYASVRSSASARVENDSSAASTVSASAATPSAKKPFERPAALDHLPEQPQQRDQVDPAGPAMHQRKERRAVHLGLEAPHELRGLLAHHRHQRLDGVQDALNPAERQRRRAECHDLAIGGMAEAPDDPDGIGDDVLEIEGGIEIVEPWPQKGHG